MNKRTSRLLRAADIACLVAFGIFAVFTAMSVTYSSRVTPIVRHVFADGTTYLISNDLNGLVIARQRATPARVGTLVANMETLDLIDVYDNGKQLPGMLSVRPPHRWIPAIDTEVVGWFRGSDAISGVGMLRPDSIFRVRLWALSLPLPFLMLMVVLTLLPLFYRYSPTRRNFDKGVLAHRIVAN